MRVMQEQVPAECAALGHPWPPRHKAIHGQKKGAPRGAKMSKVNRDKHVDITIAVVVPTL